MRGLGGHFFLIVDTDTMDFEVVPNTTQTAGRGAGIRTAQIISDMDTVALFTGIVAKLYMAKGSCNIRKMMYTAGKRKRRIGDVILVKRHSAW